ncbi:MAG: TRAP transporter small permease [Bacteroidota bacterium]
MKFQAKIDSWLGKVLIALTILITLDVLWGVATRYIGGNQASWTEELARFLLIWIGLLGTAYVSGQRKHLAIELLIPKLSPQHQTVMRGLISFLVILFALMVMLIGGLNLMYLTYTLEQFSPSLKIPMWFIYLVVPLSGCLVIYYELISLFSPTIQEA